MKKFLLNLSFILLISVIYFVNIHKIYAQSIDELSSTNSASVITPVNSSVSANMDNQRQIPFKDVLQAQTQLPQEGSWVRDPEVTFVGKVGARSGEFLDWTLYNYKWTSITDNTNPLRGIWLTVAQIVGGFLTLFVLVSAFIMIITRGRNITLRRFIIRFLGISLLVVFSYSLIQFIYWSIDSIIAFFIRVPGSDLIIQQKNLLNVGFQYDKFEGYRVYGPNYDESAFISLLLIKLTAVTYYTMSGILLLRKIILWFFIIISPIFPLLLFYSPIRNTAKIWVGEFFRWLLYAPIFAIFLNGLVSIWMKSGPNNAGIPLDFKFVGGKVIYPTAINILLGGPGQVLSTSNTVNNAETFALYIVALLMLWVVIILPFLLLQIFLDYLASFSLKENTIWKNLIATGTSILPRPGGTPPAPITQPPPSYQPTGLARALPFTAKVSIPEIRSTQLATDISALTSKAVSSEILKLTNLSIPTMRDIARYESSSMSSDVTRRAEITKMKDTLKNISNPASISSMTDRQQLLSAKERLIQERDKGNPIATSILTAAGSISERGVSTVLSKEQETSKLTTMIQKMANPESMVSTDEKQKMSYIKQQITQAANAGDSVASTLLTIINNNEKTATAVREQFTSELKEASVSGNTIANTVLKEADISDKALTKEEETNRVSSVIDKLANTDKTETAEEKEKITKIKEQLIQAAQSGDPVASKILKMTESSQSTQTVVDNNVKEKLKEAKQNGNTLAALMLSEAGISEATQLAQGVFPASNRVQQVSLDDYEAVRTMWQENYKNMDVPKEFEGKGNNRKEWVTHDIDTISQTISYLTSSDPQTIQKGMEAVGSILPFLLIGGFSQTEVVAYLKAKLEAAKSTMSDLLKQEEDEDTMLESKTGKEDKPKEMTTEAYASLEEENKELKNPENEIKKPDDSLTG